ncbi:carbon-nitrogen hydrolase family protein [Haloarchaeobius sp. TZWSO28]|uniref:carbon-nitrogen hydrolase family protein n=1 Tax=Haloarchaeobius sp. TZWSO28 TaxID=3446119 RepID=UPI003EBB87B9
MRPTRILQAALLNPDSDPSSTVETNLENVLKVLDRADSFDPDFVSFPELALAKGADGDVPPEELAVTLPGPVTDRVGEKARELGAYVWVPTYEKAAGTVYNSVGLVDPDGEFLGQYRKLAPTDGEMDRGISPGTELPTWDTPFGRVAATICWDVRFDEIGVAFGARDVNVLFHPTQGTSYSRLRNWAVYHGYHVPVTWGPYSKIYTPHGSELARQDRHATHPEALGIDLGGGRLRFSFAQINTDCKSYSRAGLDFETMDAVQEYYGGDVSLHANYDDATIVLETLAEDLRVEEVEEKFDLPTVQAYEERVREMVYERAPDSPLTPPNR